ISMNVVWVVLVRATQHLFEWAGSLDVSAQGNSIELLDRGMSVRYMLKNVTSPDEVKTLAILEWQCLESSFAKLHSFGNRQVFQRTTTSVKGVIGKLVH